MVMYLENMGCCFVSRRGWAIGFKNLVMCNH
jgi:hypothetical protein